MRVPPFTMLVSINDPASNTSFEAAVPMPHGIRSLQQGSEDLVAGVQAAAQAFVDHLVATISVDEDEIDRSSFIVETIAIQPAEGQAFERYLVDGCYSDYPEGGAWADHVMAISSDDAELQARYIMACNEDNGGSYVSVEDFETGSASTMIAVTVNFATPEPVTRDEAIDFLARLVTAGGAMLSAFGNCCSPQQQSAALDFQAALNEGLTALKALNRA